MSWFDKLERRFGRYEIPYVTQALISLQVVLFIVAGPRPDLMDLLALKPQLVLQGQFWRVVTFLAVPPQMNLFFAFFYFYLFFLMGTALESHWGAFRYNIFLLIGYIATVAVSFIIPGGIATNAFLQGSVFLAFAYLFPDFQMYLFFVIPVKIKYLAALTWLGYIYGVATGSGMTRVMILASICNFLIFFGGDLVERIKTGKRHMDFQSKNVPKSEPKVFHRCSVCGVTDADNPYMDFRYCPQCTGTPCYCADHLATHEHK